MLIRMMHADSGLLQTVLEVVIQDFSGANMNNFSKILLLTKLQTPGKLSIELLHIVTDFIDSVIKLIL